jgi:hypothetical protein
LPEHPSDQQNGEDRKREKYYGGYDINAPIHIRLGEENVGTPEGNEHAGPRDMQPVVTIHYPSQQALH